MSSSICYFLFFKCLIFSNIPINNSPWAWNEAQNTPQCVCQQVALWTDAHSANHWHTHSFILSHTYAFSKSPGRSLTNEVRWSDHYWSSIHQILHQLSIRQFSSSSSDPSSHIHTCLWNRSSPTNSCSLGSRNVYVTFWRVGTSRWNDGRCRSIVWFQRSVEFSKVSSCQTGTSRTFWCIRWWNCEQLSNKL